jgi:hypothetical protein
MFEKDLSIYYINSILRYRHETPKTALTRESVDNQTRI